MTVDVAYDLLGEDLEDMKHNLQDLIHLSMGAGIVTKDSLSTVDSWSVQVEEVN